MASSVSIRCVLRMLVILPCESRFTEGSCAGLELEVSDFAASDTVGDAMSMARLSRTRHLSFNDYSPYDEVRVWMLQQRDIYAKSSDSGRQLSSFARKTKVFCVRLLGDDSPLGPSAVLYGPKDLLNSSSGLTS